MANVLSKSPNKVLAKVCYISAFESISQELINSRQFLVVTTLDYNKNNPHKGGTITCESKRVLINDKLSFVSAVIHFDTRGRLCEMITIGDTSCCNLVKITSKYNELLWFENLGSISRLEKMA